MLSSKDYMIYQAIQDELKRQEEHIELIASENYVSKAVLEAQGSILTNKYAEGYPGKRWYGGCLYVDVVEEIAIERLKKIFNCNFANVQPHSGSQANQAVLMALLEPGDTILGLSLDCGGHLTHGSRVNLSGKWFKSVSYHVDPSSFLLDYNEIEKLANLHKPKLIIAGWSAYPRLMDMERFRQIADKVGAYLMVDMAHFAGLVAADCYPSPLPYAHVVTSTTHKTLRGPRGGIILSQDFEIAQKIDKAVFPGLQGGPLMHIITAKAVAFGEVLESSFKIYMENVVKNARFLANTLQERGFRIVTGGTDTHLLLVHLSDMTGKMACELLEQANITCNKNAIPFDPQSPFLTSGIRLGTPAGTTRGFGRDEFMQIAHWIADILQDPSRIQSIKEEVLDLCKKFPVY